MLGKWILVLALAALSAGSFSAIAQESQGQIAGVVTDSSGAAIPGAQITLTNIETGLTHALQAQSTGQYLISPVAPGTYTLTVRAPGFGPTEVRGLTVNLGMHVTEDIRLKPGDNVVEVTVTGDVPVVDTSTHDVSGVIENRQITTLPINTRQYLNLALLLPGTTQDASRTFYNNVQVGGGGTFYANGFLVDGVKNTWAEQGEPRQNFPAGAVQEFKVYITQFPAQYGLAMGGLVTVATKNGTNNLHGEGFEYWRNAALNRDNKFQQQTEKLQQTGKPPFNRNQFGGSIGGPIIRDRTHYYAAYERTQTSDSYTTFTLAPQFYSANQGTFDKPSYDQLLTGRVDHQLNNSQRMFARYAQEWNKLTYQGCGGSSKRNCYDGFIPRHSLVVGHTWTGGSSMVNDFRFQHAYASFQLGPSGQTIWTNPRNLATSAAATAALQTSYIFPSFTYGFGYQEVGDETRWQGNDVLSKQQGNHLFKFGFDVSHVNFIDATAINTKGTFQFATDQLFDPKNPATIAALQNPTLYTATIPPISTEVPTWELGFFAQDDWKVKPSLTLNLGLRYDREIGSFNEDLNPGSFPKTIPFMGDPSKRGDKLNFAPRIGLAWDVAGRHNDVIRAGYGIYHNNIQTLLNFPENRDLSQCSIIIRSPRYPDPFNGQSPTSFCSAAPPNVTVLAPAFHNPYSQQMNVGISHQFTNNFALQVDGVYEHAFRDWRNVDVNYPVNGVRPLTQWGVINQHQSVAQSKYKALFVQLDKRYSQRFLYRVSYTLSSTRDNNPQASIANYATPELDWGPSNIDRRHSLVASGSVELPWSFTLGVIWTVRSSLPFNAFSTAVNADGVLQYVPGTSRNQGNRDLNLDVVNAYRASRGLAPVTSVDSSNYNSLDLRVSRAFFVQETRRLEAIAQVFNVLGHTNLVGSSRTTSAASSSFGTMNVASNVQQAELGVRFVF